MMTMTENFIGIDGGLDGGIAVIKIRIEDEMPPVITLKDMPTKEKNGKRNYDVPKIVGILERFTYIGGRTFLERAQPFANQGLASTFKTGEQFGLMKGVLEGIGLSYKVVEPKIWQAHFGIVLPTSKKLSVPERRKLLKMMAHNKCVELYPEIKDQLHTPRGKLKDGLCDALLIAEYGRYLYEKGKV